MIGRGAYGEIWLARSLTGALRAVKVVHRITFESERAFQREFQGMSAFEPISRAHDGFVDILHVGRSRDYLYYIMELADDHVAGRDIDSIRYEPRTLKSDLARHKNLSAGESIRLGLSLTQALHALHTCSLTHRDIKPSNIIFIDGIPKLADIGLVAVAGQNSFVGTEGYVPPEGPGTPQADIFSLGKLLYEVSTGKDRLDFPEIDSRLSTRPDREQLSQLNDVLVKACANDPKKRYASAAEMHKDLAALDRGEIPARRRSPIPYAIAGAAILLLIVIAVAFHFWKTPTPSAEFDGQATIQTDPPGALIILGDHVQRSPAVFQDLEQRKYKLQIKHPGYDPLETTLDLSAKKPGDPVVFFLVRSTGRLEIQSNPAGVKISLRSEDGKVARDGTAPFTFSDLPTGNYLVGATRGDWEMHDSIEVLRGETAHKVFAFVDAPVHVTSEPNGARVSIDGQPRGLTPLNLPLSARHHDVVTHLDGWPDEQKPIEVQAEGENAVHFVFANGSVKITSAPAGATVLASGRELGQTPLVIEEVKPGPVSYELRLAGYKSKMVPGQVEPQQQLFLAEYLEKSAVPVESGQPWTNSLGMKFVAVGDIQMSIWETRVQDYDAFCAATGRRRVAPDFQQTPAHPVVKVNWFDATAFCQWLTEKERQENILTDGQLYRLPGDAEWSKAVGLPQEGGTTPESRDGKIRNEFPWGRQWPPPNGGGNYADRSARVSERTRGGIIENYSDGFAQTCPVGSFKTNALGIYDLGGNVWEWCAEGYNGKAGSGGRDWGVLRGASWATSKRSELQSSYRNVVDRSDRDVIYGFRCVLATESPGPANR